MYDSSRSSGLTSEESMIKRLIKNYVSKRDWTNKEPLLRYVRANLVNIARGSYYETNNELAMIIKCIEDVGHVPHHKSISCYYIDLFNTLASIDKAFITPDLFEEVMANYDSGYMEVRPLRQILMDIQEVQQLDVIDVSILKKVVNPLERYAEITDEDIAHLDDVVDSEVLSHNNLYILSANVRLILTSKYNGYSKDKQVSFLNQMINQQ